MTDVNRLPTLVSLQHLSFQFANGETVLDDLTLSIDHTPTGIVGRNGQGKSILAKLIAGRLSPSSGTLNRPANVAYVAQSVAVAPGATLTDVTGTTAILAALERVAQGAARVDGLELIDDHWDLAERLRNALDAAGLQQLGFADPVEHLSGGQLARVALIGALLSTPQLLVLDEPTNHLDLESVFAFEQALQGFPGAILVVSHDKAFMQAIRPSWQSEGWRLECV